MQKSDSSGNVTWTRQFAGDPFGPSIGTNAGPVAVDGAGNVLVAGDTDEILPDQINFGDMDAFVRKYDSNGNLLWTRQFGTIHHDSATDVAVDGAGNVFVVGYTTGVLHPGGTLDAEGFVRKYDSTGNLVWARNHIGFTFEQGHRTYIFAVAANSAGNVYVAGSTDVYQFPAGQVSFGGTDAFVAWFSGGNGDMLNAQRFGTSANDSAVGVAVDGADNVLVTGISAHNLPGPTTVEAFLLKYDGYLQSQLWTQHFGANSYDYVSSVAVDGAGNVLVAGGTEHVPGETTGYASPFVLKYDSSGNLGWTQPFLVLGNTYVGGVAVDGAGDVLVPGVTLWTPVAGPGNGWLEKLHPVVGSLVEVPNAVDGKMVTLTTPPGASLSNVSAVANPSPGTMPAGVSAPLGFFNFTVQGVTTGGATTVTVTLPSGVKVNNYYKFGPTPGNAQPHWYIFMFDGTTGAEIKGNVLVLHFVDGKRGDADLISNGVIVDPGAPVFDATLPTTTSVVSADVNPSVYGQPVTFSATVTVTAGSAGTPTGTVQFYDGFTYLGTGTLNSAGIATFTTPALAAGTHSITAAYDGVAYDGVVGFYGSASPVAMIETVTPAPLTVTVNSPTKITGEANPPFSVSYSGFVLGQDASVLGGTLTFSTAATTSSPPGTYLITPAGLTSGNYAITYVNGTLTVLSYSQVTTSLLTDVDSAGLAAGTRNSLDSKLRAAIKSFNGNNKKAGVNQLRAFINEVRAQKGKKIDVALAEAFIAYAQRIINAVG